MPVDTGFIVYNTKSYPNLIALFDHLRVPTVPTEMSFAVSLGDGAYEYSGNGFGGFFGQRSNLLSLRHWRMAADIKRFFRQAEELQQSGKGEQSLGDWLAEKRYSQWFIDRHIVPMARCDLVDAGGEGAGVSGPGIRAVLFQSRPPAIEQPARVADREGREQGLRAPARGGVPRQDRQGRSGRCCAAWSGWRCDPHRGRAVAALRSLPARLPRR